MCGGGGGGGGGGSSKPAPAPAASPIGAIARNRSSSTSASNTGGRYGARAMQANQKRGGKSPYRVDLSVGVANVGGNGGTGLNIPRTRG